MSSSGDLAPKADLLQEWIVSQYTLKCKHAPPRPDGLKVKELVRDFRHRLKLGLQFAMAVGMGMMISEAGLGRGAL